MKATFKTTLRYIEKSDEWRIVSPMGHLQELKPGPRTFRSVREYLLLPWFRIYECMFIRVLIKQLGLKRDVDNKVDITFELTGTEERWKESM